MRAELDEKKVIAANAQFWEQMLAMTVEPLVLGEEFCGEQGSAVGTVNLFGAWKGQVDVCMEEGLARHATAAMLMEPRETVTEADTLDAAKEIANIIAGLIKSSLPRPCTMTVPEARVEKAECRNWRRSDDSLVVAFHHATGNLVVRVLEQECADLG